MANCYFLCLFLTPLLLVSKAAAAGKVPAVIVFGDSSVDAGNNNVVPTLLRSNFKPYGRDFEGGRPTGRFCNGRIPPDFISQAFGLKPSVPAYLDPAYTISDFATGVCFASAGTGYDNATSDVLNVIPLWRELEYYKDYQNKLKSYAGARKAKKILREALYLMSLGTNDFLENYYTFPTRRSQFNIRQYEDFLVGLAGDFITELYHLGARKISLTGVPPMGCLPLERTTNFMEQHDCVQEYNEVALRFNGKLEKLVVQLNRKLSGLKLLFTKDVYDIFYSFIRRPSSYGKCFTFTINSYRTVPVIGFEVAERACCGTGTFEMSYLCNEEAISCPDANKYIFWDAFHPTEKTNKIITDHLIPILLQEFR